MRPLIRRLPVRQILVLLVLGSTIAAQPGDGQPQQRNGVQYTIPPGWTTFEPNLNAARQQTMVVTLIPLSNARGGIVVFQPIQISPGDSISKVLGQALRATPEYQDVRIQDGAAPPNETVRAAARTTSGMYAQFAAWRLQGRLQIAMLTAPDPQTAGQYGAAFESVRKSLAYAGMAPSQPQGPGNASARPASSGVGASYGARNPGTCASRKEPRTGPMSAEQARQYVVCREEGEVGGALYLIEDVRVEVGKGRPPGPEKSAFADLDHDSVVYPIRGSFTAYQCEKTNPGIPTREFYNLNANCRVHQEPNASGICYRSSFGDWTCKMEDMAQRLRGPNLRAGSGVPPPQGP